MTEFLNLIHDAVKKDLPVHPEDHVNDPQPAAVKSAADALVNALAYKPHKLGDDQVTRSQICLHPQGRRPWPTPPAAVRDAPFVPAPGSTPGATNEDLYG